MAIRGGFNDGMGTLDAQLLRLIMMMFTDGSSSDALAVQSGVRITRGAPGAMSVVAGASGLKVTVKAGACLIGGTSTTGQGAYPMMNTADYDVTLSPADGSQARYDRIIAKVTDTGDENSLYELTSVSGSPAGSPALPAIPASSMSLAYVLVPAGASTPGALTITDERLPISTVLKTHQGFSVEPFTLDGTKSTTSATFDTMCRGQSNKRFPSLRVSLIHLTDASTAAEIRVTVNGTQIAAPTVVAAGSGQFDITGPWPGAYGVLGEVDIQARVTSGPGACKVRGLSATGIN
jgi:hypothetical protein